MEQLVKYLAHDDYWTAGATVGGVISLIITARQPIMRLYRFVSQSISTSVQEAERRKRRRRAFMAWRCVSSPSYFIACLVQMILLPLVHTAFASLFIAMGYVDLAVAPIFTGRNATIMLIGVCALVIVVTWSLCSMISEVLNLSFAVTQMWHRQKRNALRQISRSG